MRLRGHKKLGRTPFVELTTSECAPCNAIKDSLSDPLMVDAFSGVYLIRFMRRSGGIISDQEDLIPVS